MPDNKRNARLAKWQGWEKLADGSAELWLSPDGMYHDLPPPYDIDPAAALELLAWLVSDRPVPDKWYAEIGPNDVVSTHVVLCSGQNTFRAMIKGPPPTALPEAIAEVAEAVRKLEEG